MELFVDPTDRRPRSLQLYEQLREAIVEGRLTPGDQLTPSRTAAAELGLSRSTVTEAYRRLSAEGYIEGRAGGGSVISGVSSAIVASPRRAAAALAPTPRAARVRRYGRDLAATYSYDLRPGRVDSSLVPVTPWRRCLLRAVSGMPGHYGDPAGSSELRTALASWVTRSRGVTATSEEVVVTSGTGHGIDLVARVLTDPGTVVAVEEPGYPPVVELLRSHGLRVVGIPVDEEGIVVEALPSSARLVYVTPSHQYPLGMVMARRRRLELLAWAARTDAAIIEDDYDGEFRHAARPLEPLQRLDRDGRVIYVGTFSKTLSPALRAGFMVVPHPLTATICAVRQVIDWCPPHILQGALTAFITDGHLDRHLRRSRAVYGERRRLAWQALGQCLPAGYRRLPAQVGLHLTVLAPQERADPRFWSAGADPDLRLGSLGATYQFTEPVAGFLLGFGGVPTPKVEAAVRTAISAVVAHAGGKDLPR